METALKFKKHIPFLTFCLILSPAFASPATAGTLKEVELTDGSVIQAEVLSFSNGVYRLRSNTLGTFSLSEDKIQSMQFRNRSSRKPKRSNFRGTPSNLSGIDEQQVQQQVQEMTQRLMQDPEAMAYRFPTQRPFGQRHHEGPGLDARHQPAGSRSLVSGTQGPVADEK